MQRRTFSARKLIGALSAGLIFLSHGSGVGLADTRPNGEIEQSILATFAQMNQVPRCSKDEGRISAWLVEWARSRGLEVASDARRNVLITVPATPGWEDRPGVILQAHMDMVCVKTDDSSHDFTRDPIPLIHDGGWVRAKDTTLGADDGIGIAIALTLVERGTKPRPKLEILITTDEEKDMSGIAGLSDSLLTGMRYINLDSEDDSAVTLGAAGGVHTDIVLPLAMTPLPADIEVFSLKVAGLLGGHSGLEIQKNRPNANVLIAQLLAGVGPFRLVSIDGGKAYNAIATSAGAVLAVEAAGVPALRKRVADFTSEARAKYPDEGAMTITLASVANAQQPAASAADSATAVRLITSVPQGVTAWSEEFDGLPETSNNIGMVASTDTTLTVATMQRSFHRENLKAFGDQLVAIANAAGAASTQGAYFPAWPPNSETGLYRAVTSSYARLFGAEMTTSVLHAGLECGYVAEKYPGMEIVSIGPKLEHVHTTDERLEVASLRKLWILLEDVLQVK